MTNLTPSQIVFALDRFIVGQQEAKKAVAIALRSRWRRLQVTSSLRDEIFPKNILMIGPTGVGKTEIARRLAKLAGAPFVKIEATKFTEIGYVGRDVEQMVRDLVDVSFNMTKERFRAEVKNRAQERAKEKILDLLIGESAGVQTRTIHKMQLESGEFDEKEIEIEVQESSSFSMPMMDTSGSSSAKVSIVNLSDMMGKAFGVDKTKKKCVFVKEALTLLTNEESDLLMDVDKIKLEALNNAQENGIIFLDEIDKICGQKSQSNANVSREGVQRDLLPLIEGTTVSTKYGAIRTDHILFIASGAFHLSKPSDLLPELQGRLPIRVHLQALTEKDFVRILTEPETNLIRQYRALLKVEDIDLELLPEAIEEIALFATTINQNVENIGARRLHTILEKLLEDISYSADLISEKTIRIGREEVRAKILKLAENQDLSRFVL